MATAMDHTSVFKSNWDKYLDAMKYVVTKEIIRVFLWLYKGGHQHPGDYLEDMRKKHNKKYHLYKDQKIQLENKDPVTNMDIPLLYTLIQHTCDLEDADSSVWNNPELSDKNSLEHTLYQLKQERNKIHEVQRLAMAEISYTELKLKIDNLRWLCCNMLSEAGRISGRLMEITTYTDNVEHKLSIILGIDSERFVQLAREEKKSISDGGRSGCDLGYLAPMMKHRGNLVELKSLLHIPTENGSAPNIILITGDAGAGKSSLTRYLDNSWVEERQGSLCDVCGFDLVLLVPCSSVSTTDVAQLLREELLPQTANWCDPYTLIYILAELKILWILDGLEESTPQAAKLLEKLVKMQTMKDLIMVTSRPEQSMALTAQLNNNNNVLIVTLCGVDPEAMITTLQSNNHPDAGSHLHITQTIEYFNKLNDEIQEELRNPLKMQLLIEDLENRELDIDIGFDLTRLYEKHKDKQVQTLVKKNTSSHITERNVKRKVNKWLLTLCKVAFDRVKYKKISNYNLSCSELKQLEDKCDDLGLSSSEFLSTFLSHPSITSATENPKYIFYHGTQQHFLAAMFVSSIIEESSDVTADLCTLFGLTDKDMDNEQECLLHFYEMMLQLVTIYTNSVIKENLVVELIHFLSHIIPSHLYYKKGFEIVQRGSYNSIILQEVSKFMPEAWLIGYYNLKAAMYMCQYKTPEHIIFFLDMSIEHSQLVTFLQLLASLPVIISLFDEPPLLDNTICGVGRYLKELCMEDSHCTILELGGYLSHEEYDLLRQPVITDYCKKMVLSVKSKEELKELCNIMEDMEFLEYIELSLEIINLSFISNEIIKIPNHVNVTLRLPYVTDKSTIAAAKLVNHLSEMYNVITLYQLSDKGARDFVKRLKKHGVIVNMLERVVTDIRQVGIILRYGNEFSDGHPAGIILRYGPLPLRYPLQDFMWYWRDLNKYFTDSLIIQKYLSPESDVEKENKLLVRRSQHT